MGKCYKKKCIVGYAVPNPSCLKCTKLVDFALNAEIASQQKTISYTNNTGQKLVTIKLTNPDGSVVTLLNSRAVSNSVVFPTPDPLLYSAVTTVRYGSSSACTQTSSYIFDRRPLLV